MGLVSKSKQDLNSSQKRGDRVLPSSIESFISNPILVGWNYRTVLFFCFNSLLGHLRDISDLWGCDELPLFIGGCLCNKQFEMMFAYPLTLDLKLTCVHDILLLGQHNYEFRSVSKFRGKCGGAGLLSNRACYSVYHIAIFHWNFLIYSGKTWSKCYTLSFTECLGFLK